MPHYNRNESFKIKKRKYKPKILDTSFTLKDSKDYGIVVETKYNQAHILYNNKIVKATLNTNKQKLNQIIFPGDKVTLSQINNTYTITNLLDRTSLLSRVKTDRTRNTKTTKNIAANIDLAVIVVSAKEPPLHPNFIDRYLIILKNSNIDYIICLNKCELKTEKEEQILDIYKKINIKVIETSTIKNIGIDHLKQHLKNKQAILLGHSGVGKSSLLNSIMNYNKTKTSKISQKTKKGRHTTTSSKYYIWDKNSSIIDTPGIRSLDTSFIRKEDIKEFFPEFNNITCKYKNCTHHHEPLETCMVKQKVKDGNINKQRYESYIKLLEN